MCRYKNAGVAGYAEAFLPVQSDSQTSEWCSYFENDVLNSEPAAASHGCAASVYMYSWPLLPSGSKGGTTNILFNPAAKNALCLNV